VARGDIETYGQAGISGSDIGDEGFRLVAGVSVGPPVPSIPLPQPPAPPPPPRVKHRIWLLGQAPELRPELERHDQISNDGGFWWVTFSVVGAAGVTLAVVMALLNLTHRI